MFSVHFNVFKIKVYDYVGIFSFLRGNSNVAYQMSSYLRIPVSKIKLFFKFCFSVWKQFKVAKFLSKWGIRIPTYMPQFFT